MDNFTFLPKNELEQAFFDCDLPRIHALIGQGKRLNGYEAFLWAHEHPAEFSDETLAELLQAALPPEVYRYAHAFAETVWNEDSRRTFCRNMIDYLIVKYSCEELFEVSSESESDHEPLKNVLENLTPEGKLESAILAQDYDFAVQCIADGFQLERPDLLATREFFDSPIGVAALVVQVAMTYPLRKRAFAFLHAHYPESEVIWLLQEIMAEPASELSGEERKLFDAAAARDDVELQRLIQEESLSFHQVPTELFLLLPELKKRTVFLLFYGGFNYLAKARALQFLFAESEQPDKLRSLGYKRILMYTNLLIHILQQKIAPEDSERIDGDWYPMGGTIADGYDPKNPCFTYSYYYDPRFLYRPASYSDRYEEPVHDVDPDSQD